MSRRRHLSAEERELWNQIAASARALRPVRPLPHDPAPHPKVAPKAPLHRAPDLAPFTLGERALPRAAGHNLSPTPHERLKAEPLRMDHKTYGRMARGKLAPEARIDLHGMTLSEAHAELIHFVLTSQAQGLRFLLVITGKGKAKDSHGPAPDRIGALRHQVPHWLMLPPVGSHVLQVAPASLRHGGQGAYYVYLKRSR
ncbi:Smr/MutS family protein [Frigidibacter sp. RF13]|uniref:Smr/MutS family protein n=1 Tax=Frigidibacter sp. RF13 TaxID=2997340 RepID=UPI00226ECF1B|nr:Smr/MutS family protein [Frigidibacter sp. RF13]MCY1126410.1 Smr/MutS family protein [Frigidibacter sp. RF13]